MAASKQDVERCMIELLRRRAKTSSICPSDVARALAGDDGEWRALMPLVRAAAARMAHEDTISITQGSTVLDPDRIDHGAIRLRRGPKFPAVE
jgi:hypothetical protein